MYCQTVTKCLKDADCCSHYAALKSHIVHITHLSVCLSVYSNHLSGCSQLKQKLTQALAWVQQ